MKALHHTIRILLGIIFLLPALGGLGVFPQPTADMYTSQGWAFISALINTGYMFPLIGVFSIIVAIFAFANRTALAAIMLLPFTVNIVLFHVILDATPVSASSALAYIVAAINIFLLWYNWKKYLPLFTK